MKPKHSLHQGMLHIYQRGAMTGDWMWLAEAAANAVGEDRFYLPCPDLRRINIYGFAKGASVKGGKLKQPNLVCSVPIVWTNARIPGLKMQYGKARDKNWALSWGSNVQYLSTQLGFRPPLVVHDGTFRLCTKDNQRGVRKAMWDEINA